MSWNIVKGHQDRIESLRTSLVRGNLHHALLLSGSKGIGKSLIATCLAASLLCSEAPDGDFCGECNICQRIFRKTHPDVVTVCRDKDSRFITIGEGERAKGNLIHSIRPLCELANKKPFESSLKVFIVDEAEWIRSEAQDAFLKTLEEPPANTFFFLVCTNAQKLKETIRSRSMLINLFPLSFSDSKEVVLQHSNDVDSEQLDTSLVIGRGSPGKSLQLLEEGMYEEVKFFFNLVSKLGKLTPIELSGNLYDHVINEVGKKILERVRQRLIFYFDAFLCVLSQDSIKKDLEIKPEFIQSLSYIQRADICTAVLEAISDLRYNVRPQLVADNLFERIDKRVRKQ